jgi:hypothetical protein
VSEIIIVRSQGKGFLHFLQHKRKNVLPLYESKIIYKKTEPTSEDQDFFPSLFSKKKKTVRKNLMMDMYHFCSSTKRIVRAAGSLLSTSITWIYLVVNVPNSMNKPLHSKCVGVYGQLLVCHQHGWSFWRHRRVVATREA